MSNSADYFIPFYKSRYVGVEKLLLVSWYKRQSLEKEQLQSPTFVSFGVAR
jgi:hypothetical protein